MSLGSCCISFSATHKCPDGVVERVVKRKHQVKLLVRLAFILSSTTASQARRNEVVRDPSPAAATTPLVSERKHQLFPKFQSEPPGEIAGFCEVPIHRGLGCMLDSIMLSRAPQPDTSGYLGFRFATEDGSPLLSGLFDLRHSSHTISTRCV